MIAALLPVLAAPATPLRLEIEAPKSVRSGESAHVKVWLVNVSRAPVVVVAPSPMNYELGIRFHGDFYRADRPVATNWTGLWYGQWMRVQEYDDSAFVRIAPGDRIAVEDGKYESEYLSGQRPGLISEVSTAPRRDLPAGEYVYRAAWSFGPTLGRKTATDRPSTFANRPQTLSAAAKGLYAQAWAGRLRVERPITVLPK